MEYFKRTLQLLVIASLALGFSLSLAADEKTASTGTAAERTDSSLVVYDTTGVAKSLAALYPDGGLAVNDTLKVADALTRLAAERNQALVQLRQITEALVVARDVLPPEKLRALILLGDLAGKRR